MEKLMKKKNELTRINVKQLKKSSQLNLDSVYKPMTIMTTPNSTLLAEHS